MPNEKQNKGWPDKAVDYFNKRKSRLWGSIFVPFIICFKHKVDFFIWVMFVLVAGQLGTIINLVNGIFFQDLNFSQAIYPDSVFGSFYTYALVLMASLIAPVFTDIRNDREPKFRSMTMAFTTLLIFVLIFCAVFYSFASQEAKSIDIAEIKKLSLSVDVKQLVFFILSLFCAWYAFGLQLMTKNREGTEFSDTYIEKEQKSVEQIEKKSEAINSDGNNVAL